MNAIIFAIIPILLVAILIAVLKTRSEGGTAKIVIGATVAIIVIAVALIPAIGEFDAPRLDSVQYDDYLEVDATSAEGSFELVTLGGVTYAHAAALGPGQINYTDGTTKQYDVVPAKLDVFMFLGQSNIAYWVGKYIDGTYYDHAIPDQVTPKPAPGTSYYYGSETSPYLDTTTNLSTMGIYDMVDLDTGDCKVGSLDAPFASGYFAETNNKCLIVNCGWSGTSIESYVPGGKVYNHAKSGWNDAISKIDLVNFKPTVKGYIFCQGEADWNMPVEEYTQKFITMNNTLKDGSFSETKLTNCWIDLVREPRAVNAYQAQLQLAEDLAHVKIASTISATFSISGGTLMVDNLHYTQLGQNIIAAQLVASITG